MKHADCETVPNREHCLDVLERFARDNLQFSREYRHELINEFYPTLLRLLRSFQDRGVPLDRYVIYTFRLFLRQRRVRVHRERHLRLLCSEGAIDGYTHAVAEPATPYADRLFSAETPLLPRRYSPDGHRRCAADPEDVEQSTRVVQPVRLQMPRRPSSPGRDGDCIRRYALFVLCKNAPMMSQSEVLNVAQQFGLPVGYVTSMWITAREMAVDQIERRANLERLRDRHFTALLEMQRRESEAETPLERQAYRALVETHRTRLHSARRRLQRSPHLTHLQISTLLGVPKGSVDSLMAKMRVRFAQ